MELRKPIKVLLEEYLSELSGELSTIDQYRKTILLFILWISKREDFKASEPTRASFCFFYQELKNKGLSVRTIDNYTTAIRMFFKWLIENEYYDKNITEGTKALRKSYDFIKAPLPEDKAMMLLQSFKDESAIELRDFAIVNTMLRLGLRRIEITRLNYEDFTRAGSQWYIRIQGKGHSEKDAELPITTRILKPIQQYWKHRPDMGPGIPAFISHANCSSKRITPHFVSVMVKARFRAIGLDDKLFSSHSLRHSAAYYATKAGSSSFEVQQMMRHKDGRATEQYKKAFNQERIKDGTSIFYLDNYLKKCQERCGK